MSELSNTESQETRVTVDVEGHIKLDVTFYDTDDADDRYDAIYDAVLSALPLQFEVDTVTVRA